MRDWSAGEMFSSAVVSELPHPQQALRLLLPEVAMVRDFMLDVRMIRAFLDDTVRPCK
jgi:hypothetical protein